MTNTYPTPASLVRAGLLIAGLLVIVLVWSLYSSSDLVTAKVGGDDGKLGGEFTLQGVNGDVSLSDFRGKVVMLYFGFVTCSQVCPVSMKIMQNTVAKMSPEEAANVQVILISVDVETDDVDSLAEYTKQYNPDFIGLTGTLDQIDQVINEYGAFFSPTELKDTDPSRAFRHSSRYYIINQQGELVDAMRHSSTANELVARVRTLLPKENLID